MAEAAPAPAAASAPAAPDKNELLAEEFRKLAEAASNIAAIFAGGGIGEGGKKKRRKRGEGKNKGDKADKPKRKPTEFNLYMQSNLSALKEKHPELTHREAFKECAHQWKSTRTATAATGAVAMGDKGTEVASKPPASASKGKPAQDEPPVVEGEKKKKKKKKKHHDADAAEAEEGAAEEGEPKKHKKHHQEEAGDGEEHHKKHKKHKKKDKEREPEVSE